MRLDERLLLCAVWAGRAIHALLALWLETFLRLGLVGKVLLVIASLYGGAWLAFRLGFRGLGTELGHAGWTVTSYLIAGGVCAALWTNFVRRRR